MQIKVISPVVGSQPDLEAEQVVPHGPPGPAPRWNCII